MCSEISPTLDEQHHASSSIIDAALSRSVHSYYTCAQHINYCRQTEDGTEFAMGDSTELIAYVLAVALFLDVTALVVVFTGYMLAKFGDFNYLVVADAIELLPRAHSQVLTLNYCEVGSLVDGKTSSRAHTYTHVHSRCAHTIPYHTIPCMRAHRRSL